MSISTRLEDEHQTTVVLVEDDYNENPDEPAAAMIYDAEELERLLSALLQARINLANQPCRNYCREPAGSFSCEHP